MSQVAFDNYWPLEEPARQANLARWRRMGRLWLHNGVVQGVGEQFPVHGGGWNPAEGRILIGTGAGFIEGFYGATANWTWVSTPGNDGMVKLRLDTVSTQQMFICFEAWHGFHDDPAAAHGVVETPLWEVWPDGRSADRRLMVSPDVVQGLERIPEWVPKGGLFEAQGPATAVEVATGAIAFEVALHFAPGWDDARLPNVRVAGWAGPSAGAGWNNSWVHLRALTLAGALIKESRLSRPSQGGTPVPGYGELILERTTSARIVFQVQAGLGNVFFPANCCYVSVEDLGIP